MSKTYSSTIIEAYFRGLPNKPIAAAALREATGKGDVTKRISDLRYNRDMNIIHKVRQIKNASGDVIAQVSEYTYKPEKRAVRARRADNFDLPFDYDDL